MRGVRARLSNERAVFVGGVIDARHRDAADWKKFSLWRNAEELAGLSSNSHAISRDVDGAREHTCLPIPGKKSWMNARRAHIEDDNLVPATLDVPYIPRSRLRHRWISVDENEFAEYMQLRRRQAHDFICYCFCEGLALIRFPLPRIEE